MIALGGVAGFAVNRLETRRSPVRPQGPTIQMTAIAPPAPAIAQPPAAAEHHTTTGLISITAKPFATIFIDGHHCGKTPLIDLELAPGPHVVHAVSRTGKTRDVRIQIVAGRIAPERRITW